MKRGHRDPKSSQGRARPNVLDPWCSKIMCFRIFLPHEGYGQHLLALIPNAKSDYPPGHQAVTTSSSLQHHPRLHILPQSIPSDSSISVHVHTMGLSYWRPHLHPYGRTPSSHCSTGCKTRSVGPYVLRHRIFSIEPSPSVDYLFFCSFHSCCSVV